MSFSYFNRLNYTLANEDSALEMAMVPRGTGHAVTVTGSGARALPLLNGGLGRLTMVDLVPEQLMLAELRVQAMRALGRDEYLAFWGYPPVTSSPAERMKVLANLTLRPDTREFFTGLFAANGGQPILYSGRWERTFAKIAKAMRFVCGERAQVLFAARSLMEQRHLLNTEFPHWRWQLAVGLLGNSSLFNSLLYKGHFPKLNVASGHYRFYAEAFHRLFNNSIARENFFLQIVFFGELRYAEGLPVECRSGTYEAIKAALVTTEVTYQQANIIDWLGQQRADVDFVSLSDVPSYFSGELAENFLQRIKPALRQDGLVVVRSYLHRPHEMRTDGYEDTTTQWWDAIAREATQMYLVDVLRRT